MTGPPGVRPEMQGAVGAGPLGERAAKKLSTHVKIVNSVFNGSGYLKRKVAEYYVAEGRAEFVADDQLRLIESHPKNRAAARRATWGYENVTRVMTIAEMKHLPIIQRRKSTGRHGALGRSTPDRVLFRQAGSPSAVGGTRT
jgi:hypothetical protein